MDTKSIQKCSSINDPWDTIFTERISLLFAKFFAKHNVKPNIVTLLSIITGVVGAICIIFHNIWITIAGILLEILAAIFDCADGQVARMTHTGSKFGRFFDGFGDSVVYTSIYIALTIRIMSEKITFTNTYWGWWIWLVAIPVAAYFHTRQARLADYYKQVYMYMIKNDRGSELETSEALTEEFKESKLKPFQKLMVKSYITYTKAQEHENPTTKKLIGKIKENNNIVPEKVSELYRHNVKWVKATNLLVFNLRTYIMFALLITEHFLGIGLDAWLLVLILFVFEPIALIIEFRFEKIAKIAINEGFVDEI